MHRNDGIVQAAFLKDNADKLIAIFLAAVVLALSLLNLDNNCPWGDDYAAYLSEGIAIAEGKLDEQAELNTMMHLTELPEQSKGKPLVYVWGYPLLHSLVYKLVGFDREVYDDLVYYKLATVVALALLAGIYYLFCRKRFGRPLSFLLAGILCFSPEFTEAAGNLYNDLLFTSLCVTALWLSDECCRKESSMWKAALLGVLLWYIYCVRLNGILVLITVFAAYLYSHFKNEGAVLRKAALTAASFAILYVIFNLLVFPKPSALSSLTDNLSIAWVKEGFIRQYYELNYWFNYVVRISTHPLFSVISKISQVPQSYAVSMGVSTALIKLAGILVYLLMGIFLLGTITQIKKEPHIVFFVLVSFLGTSIANLNQGMRYIYPILPYVLVFTASGIRSVLRIIKAGLSYAKKQEKNGKLPTRKRVFRLLIAVYFFSVVFTAAKPVAAAGLEKQRFPRRQPNTAYSEAAVDMYAFIQENVEEDASIAFFKPRALYLNTQRKSLSPYEPQYEVTDTDYYLHYLEGELLINEQLEHRYELLYENAELVLYKKTA